MNKGREISQPGDIRKIATDSQQSVERRQLAVSAALLEARDEGVALAQQMISEALVDSEVACAANFLAALPGHIEIKNQLLAGIIEQNPQCLTAGASLVRDASELTRMELLDYLLSLPDPVAQRSAVFEMCTNFPSLMRQHHQHFSACDIFLRVLPGAPDQWVEKLTERYLKEHDEYWLNALGQIRTSSSLAALTRISTGPDPSTQELALMMIEGSGVVPETGKPSIYDSPQRGYVVASGKSQHHMGDTVDFDVAVCPVHGITAELVLALAEPSNTGLGAAQFYWYESPFEAGYLFARQNGDRVEFPLSNVGPQAEPVLFPGPLSMQLEPMDQLHGFGGRAIPGFLQHQVGGLPQFVQAIRFPHCVDCGQTMPFAASIDSGLSPFGSLDFGGTLYGFWCGGCHVSCVVRQVL